MEGCHKGKAAAEAPANWLTLVGRHWTESDQCPMLHRPKLVPSTSSMKQRMGPQAPGQALPNTTAVARAVGATNTAKAVVRHQPVPAGLADVALIDASASAAAGSMSISWWLAEVAARRAPAPVLRRPRCTRWRLVDVHAFWRDFGSQADTSAADAVKAQATKASAAAQARRRTVVAAANQADK